MPCLRRGAGCPSWGEASWGLQCPTASFHRRSAADQCRQPQCTAKAGHAITHPAPMPPRGSTPEVPHLGEGGSSGLEPSHSVRGHTAPAQQQPIESSSLRTLLSFASRCSIGARPQCLRPCSPCAARAKPANAVYDLQESARSSTAAPALTQQRQLPCLTSPRMRFHSCAPPSQVTRHNTTMKHCISHSPTLPHVLAAAVHGVQRPDAGHHIGTSRVIHVDPVVGGACGLVTSALVGRLARTQCNGQPPLSCSCATAQRPA